MKLQLATCTSVLFIVVALFKNIKADELDDKVNTASQDIATAVAARKDANDSATLANNSATSANFAAANANMQAASARTSASAATSAQNALANGNPNFPIIYAGLKRSAMNTAKAARVAANIAQNAADRATAAAQVASDASVNAAEAAYTANEDAVNAEDSSNAINKLIDDNPGNYVGRVLSAELISNNGRGVASTTSIAVSAASNTSLAAKNAATNATSASKSASNAAALAASAAAAGGQ